jgi:hypothetical protein
MCFIEADDDVTTTVFSQFDRLDDVRVMGDIE